LKKLHQYQKIRLARLSDKEMLRRKTLNVKKRICTGSKLAPERKAWIYQNSVNLPMRIVGIPRAVPAILSLVNNWDETVTFLSAIRTSLSDGIDIFKKRGLRKPDGKFKRSAKLKIGTYSDFTTIQSISIPVALMLASEYDRVRKITNWAPFAIDIEKWKPEIRSLLDDIGFLELAGVNFPTSDLIQSGSLKILRLRCGDSADGEAVGQYFEALGLDLTEKDTRLYDAIMEAVTNIVHHAYKDETLNRPHTIANWWLVAAISDAEMGRRRLQIVVYDQGASIPQTLPSWDRYPYVQRKLKELFGFITGDNIDTSPSDARYDGDAIRLAIEVGRSSTAEGNRGKGLDQIVKALELCFSGSVVIYSRQGEFRQDECGNTQSINRSVPMVGTMVSWDLHI
jgi:hypothetical protein